MLQSAQHIISLLEDNLTDPYPDIPGDLKLPFIGSTYQFSTDVNGFLERSFKKYGNIFKLRVLGNNVIALMGAEANQLVLHTDQDNFLSKDGWEFVLGDLFKDAIMLSDGAEHKRYRSIMQSAFHKQPMIGYLGMIETAVEEFLDSEIRIRRGKLITYPEIVRLTMLIAGRLFFGMEFDTKHLDAITDVTRAASSPIRFEIPLSKYKKGMDARRLLTEFYSDKIVEKRRNPGDDMFSQMCIAQNEEGQQYTDEEIINQMIFVMMASHDTTTSTLTSMVYETARSPEWQERMRAEAHMFYEKGPLEYNRLKEFEEIGYVLNECLRLHPALVAMPRKVVKGFDFKGYHIPADTIIAVSPHISHRDPAVWSNPEEFDPLRFSPERAEHKKASNCFIPFGAGRHVCIGKYFAEMEAKITMSHFARRFKWSVPKGYKMRYAPPLNHPHDGLPVSIERIS